MTYESKLAKKVRLLEHWLMENLEASKEHRNSKSLFILKTSKISKGKTQGKKSIGDMA